MTAAIAITVFVVAYALIASDRINKTLVALCGAGIVLALGIVDAAVFAASSGIPCLHIEPAVVALLGAGILILISRLEQRDYLASVECES